MAEQRFLRLNQVRELVPVSHTTIWEWVKAGKFPKPIKLGPKTTVWDASSVSEWMEERTQEGKAA